MIAVIPEPRTSAQAERMGATAATIWSRPDIVGNFARSAPNPVLMDYARQHRCPWSSTRVLDIGCGAGRNAVPLALDGFDVIGIDRSRAMLEAVSARKAGRLTLIEAGMDDLPIQSDTIDLIVAHGIWNLARSDGEWHAAIAEAARVAAPGAALFVFTFSRNTLPSGAASVAGQRYVFTQFSGEPQVFLTREQLLTEMGAFGFSPDPNFAMRELNLPPAGQARIGGAPVIFEAAFRVAGG